MKVTEDNSNGRESLLFHSKRGVVTINGHKISVFGSSGRSSITSALAIKEEQNFIAVDDILDSFGLCNRYILFVLICLAACWSLGIMSVMRAMFYGSGLRCSSNDKMCLKERWHMFTIEDQFHIHEGSWASIEWNTTIFFLGDLVGGVFLSILSDVVGRQMIVFPSLFLSSMFGILSTYAQTFPTFLIIRFCEGFFFTGSTIIAWIFASECVSVQRRAKTLMLFGLFWVFGYCSIALIAKTTTDWRHATISMCVVVAVLAVMLWLIVPDSFHFLAEHSRAEELTRWLYNADKNLFEVALLTRVLEEKPVNHSLKQFFQFITDNPIYIRDILLSSALWSINFFIYIGSSFYSIKLGGEVYLNYILSGVVELPAFFLAPLLLDGFGRKNSLILLGLFNTGCFVLLAFINHSNRVFFLAVWLVGKCGLSATFSYQFVYGLEIFPARIRNTVLGLLTVFYTIGAAFGPHVYRTAEIHRSLPWLIFGSLSVVSVFCMRGLPETQPSRNTSMAER